MTSTNRTASRGRSRLPLPVMAAIGFALLAVVSGIWAVRLQGEIADHEREITELRSGANASVFELTPTEFAPTASRGQVFIGMTGSGAVIASNLPQPGDNEEFMLWYLHDDGTAVSGGTMNIDANGQGFALIPGDMEGYSQVAISLELSGTAAPDGNYLLIAEVRSGRG